MQLGFIGLGIMGRPMAENILKAGNSLSVFDMSESAVSALADKGAAACSSALEAAKGSEIVFLSLPNEKIVMSVLTDKKGVFASISKGSKIVDFSSISPGAAKRFSELAGKLGVTYIDAPVSGGQSGAIAGTLTIMAGCDKDTFETVRPALETVGKKLFCLGASGHGAAIKMVNNLLLGCNMAALSEALVLGKKYGLTAETMSDVIGVSSGRSYAFEAKLKKFIMADSFDGGFAVDLQRKDLGLAMEASRECAMPLPMTAAAVQVYETARAEGLGRKDISSLVKIFEDLSKVKVIDK